MKIRTTLAAAGALLGLSGAATADIVSTFDSDAEGWIVRDSADPASQSTSSVPLFTNANGNPGGFIRPPVDWTGVSFLAAPDTFLGNQADLFGGRLLADRRFYEAGGISLPLQADYAADVTITGVDGTITLAADLGIVQLLSWGTHSVEFSESGGWFHLDTGVPATNDEIAMVLADLEDLRIRGNLNADGGEIALDNVILRPVPTPGTLALLGLGSLVSMRRRR